MGIASKVVGQRPSPIFKGIRARRESDSLPPCPSLNLPLELRGLCSSRHSDARCGGPGALLLLLPSVLQRGSDR